MQDLASILAKRLNQHQLGESASAATVVCRAQELLNRLMPQSTGHLRVAFLRQAVLWVECDSAVWSQELFGHTDKILASLRTEFGPRLVRTLRTKQLTEPLGLPTIRPAMR